MTGIAVRAARPDDVPTLVALMGAFYAESRLPLPEAAAARSFATLLAEPALGWRWLLEADGAPAARVSPRGIRGHAAPAAGAGARRPGAPHGLSAPGRPIGWRGAARGA